MAYTLNSNGQKISSNWHSVGGDFLKCPYPGCSHTGEIITKYHCRNNHGMERDEMGKEYGFPVVVTGIGIIVRQNPNRWYNTGTGYRI